MYFSQMPHNEELPGQTKAQLVAKRIYVDHYVQSDFRFCNDTKT